MASRTQLRLSQITGSFASTNTNRIFTTEPKSTLANVKAFDLSGSLSHIASAIQRIHGKGSGEAFDNTAGEFYQNLTIDTGGAASLTIGGGDNADMQINFNQDTQDYYIGVDADDSDKFVFGRGNTVGTNGDLTIDTSGNATFGADATVNGDLTVNNNLSVTGNATVSGDLTVTGDIAYQYVTSSVVEFNDPMVVLNAVDPTSNAGLLSTASFPNGASDLESDGTNEAAFDYGTIFKRSVGYSVSFGAIIDPSALSTFPGEVSRQSDSYYDSQTDGSPFAVFHLKNEANPINAGTGAPGDIITLNLEPGNRSNAAEADLLGAMKGAYVVVSSSAAAGKKAFGYVRGHDSANNRVELQLLGSTETYCGVANNQTVASSDLENGKGSIHLLSAYGGTILNKSDGIFHMAAAAITGSGDNKFISGSANILQYGGVAAGKLQLFSNDNVSGSLERLSAVFDNSTDTGSELLLNTQNSTDLVLSSSADLKIVTSGGHIILTQGFDPTDTTSNANVLCLNSSGEIELATQASIAGAGSATSKGVKILTTGVTAGQIVNFNSVDVGDTISGLSQASSQGASVEVYVNGQLLISGSATERAAGTRDYDIEATGTSVKFAFDLEADDVIQLIKRPN